MTNLKNILVITILLFTGGWCFSQSDQNLDYFTYYGNNGEERSYGAIITDASETIVVGITSSTIGIASDDAHQTFYGGGDFDGLITKWDLDGNLVWATYLGGDGNDIINSIAPLSNGNFVVSGYTSSLNNISTPGAFQEDLEGNIGNNNAFLSVFDTNGQIVWSTFFGGTMDIKSDVVCTDLSDNIYLTCRTSDPNLATPGAHQTTNGFFSPIITKFNSNGDRLWSTYFGSDELDQVYSAQVDQNNNLILAGTTWSSEGLATSGAELESGQGSFSMFLCKFSEEGTLLWSTYISGEGNDYGRTALGITSNNEIILAGYTHSLSGIATPGAHLESNLAASQSNHSLFIVRYNADGFKIWGTYFGQGGIDGQLFGETAIHYDFPHFYLTARTYPDPQIIFGENPFQPDFAGTSDILVAKFHESGNVIWSSYFGGSGDENTCYLRTLPDGRFLLVGHSSSEELYANSNSYQQEYGGNTDLFLAYFSDNLVSAQNIFQNPEAIILYPNPGTENFYLTWDDLSIPNAVDIGIYDLQGRKLFEEKGYQKEQPLNLVLSSGNYLLRIHSENRSHTLKFIKSD